MMHDIMNDNGYVASLTNRSGEGGGGAALKILSVAVYDHTYTTVSIE